MAKNSNERKIVATQYTYKKNADGSLERIKKGKTTKTEHTTWGSLRNQLISTSKGKDGEFVKFTGQYKTVRVAVPRKIKYHAKTNKDGTITRTYYNREAKNPKK